MIIKRTYGWWPDLPDAKDWKLSLPKRLVPLPSLADLRPQCPPVWDQGQLGSCTAHAIGFAYEFARQKQGLPPFDPSRLFIYYNERAAEGTIQQDAGAMIRDGIKSLANQGVCSETLWPYDPDKFADEPPTVAYAAAVNDLAIQYQAPAQNLYSLKSTLAGGIPVVFGMSVYDSFESDAVASTGIVPMPDLKNESVIGGHAIAAVGYDDTQQWFIVRNSYGAGWGMKGYFTLPYAYVTSQNLVSDLWVIQRVK
jgi:C1A family cysteine protease